MPNQHHKHRKTWSWMAVGILLVACSLVAIWARAGDDLLDDTTDLTATPQQQPTAAASSKPASSKPSNSEGEAEKLHAKLFVENKYPPAEACRTCHPDHYRE